MNLVPLGRNVVMKMWPKKTVKNGIRLSDGAAEESDFADVVAVGPFCEHLEVGDTVLRPTPANYEWTDEDDGNQLYLICEEEAIACKTRK